VAGSIPASALKYIIMNVRELQVKIAKEFGLDKAIKKANDKKFDKWLNNLIKRNGTTKY
tara:strand:+ start:1634 stop:1810 length:177 start_codon:yes stop_codon:yes gene_type:complete